MVAFELFAIAHNLNAELSTLGITSKEAENDSSLYDHLIVNESLREKTRELYFDGHYTRVIEEAFKLIDNLVKEMIIAAELLRRSRLRCCGVPRCAATR